MTEPTVDQMIDDIIRREGGYVNHPKDRGGPTKYGITQKTLSAWPGVWSIPEGDVENITEDDARDIYREEYYVRPGIAKLPPALQPFLFDCAVNHGPSRAVKFLQRACEAKEDGRIGPATLAQVDKYTPEGLLRTLIDIRRNFYLNIVRNDPGQKVFLTGWLNRLAEFEQEQEPDLATQLAAAKARIAELEAALTEALDRWAAGQPFCNETVAELERKEGRGAAKPTAAGASGDRVAHPSLDTSVVPGSAPA